MIKKYDSYLNGSKLIKEDKIFENSIGNPNLSLVLPGGCNGKCDFCFWKKSKPCSNYLEKLNNVLTNLPSQFYKLSITGGEPTMSPYLENVLEMIDRDVFKHTVLTSNGYKLLDFVPILEGKIDHINISRHHHNENINNSIFKSKMITNDQLKFVTNELNKIGIDVTFSAVLNENLSTDKDIKEYIKFAKDCGASQIFFRKPHGTLEPTEIEKFYENYKSKEYKCPVCRTKNQLIEGMRVSWKSSLEEPSKEIGYIYELIVNENAEVTKDWEGKLKVDYNKINENRNGYVLNEECGGGSSEERKKPKRKFKVGDKVLCIDTSRGKLPEEAVEFLKMYRFFKVLNVKEDYKIDIGYVTSEDKVFYFSSTRFKRVNENDPYDEEDWEESPKPKKKKSGGLYQSQSHDEMFGDSCGTVNYGCGNP